MPKLPSRQNRPFGDIRNMFDDIVGEISDNRFVRNVVGNSFKLDVEETEKSYIIHAELPGTKKEEVNVSMNEGQLTISVNKLEEATTEGKNYIHKERYQSSMSRSIYLHDAKTSGITAKLSEGILTVTVEKEAKPDATINIDIE